MGDIAIKDLQICVVEPSRTQAKIIENVLHELEVKNINLCSGGIEAIDSMETSFPDLVISSMYLPDMTGTDVVLSMRDSTTLAAIPFMLISSETSFAMLEPIRQAGVIAILPKPFKTSDLKKALYSTLDFISPDLSNLADIDMDELEVLVVDDSTLARKHVMRVLKNVGIEKMTQAKNGKEAVKLINNNFYDLVVTDYNMPEMDGEMLTRYIREESSQASIPIIMVTSEGNKQRLTAVQQAGISGICDKPFETSVVTQLIRNVLLVD